MTFKQRFMALNINGFKPASLLANLHPILALIAIGVISLATLALLPFLIMFAAITFITISFFGKKIIAQAMKQANVSPYQQHAQPESFNRAAPHKGRTFEHNPD